MAEEAVVQTQEPEKKKKEGLALTIDRITYVVAVIMGIYHLVAANFTIFQAGQHINIHLTLSLIIVCLQGMKLKNNKIGVRDVLLMVMLAASIITGVYIHFHYTQFMTAFGAPPMNKVLSGLSMLILIMIATKMTWGLVIPIIAIIALLYGYFGPYLPGPFFHAGLSFPRLITYVTTNFDGIYGMLASVSAYTIVLFTIFGGMLDAFGAINAIMSVAMKVGNKVRSGTAQVTIISAGLIGMISGSVAANITLTGSVCMPLMIKKGYSKEFTAATEAAASTGGAILPPVMNAAAFIIASWTGIPYINLVFIGFTPALLYYFGIMLSAYIRTLKMGDEEFKEEVMPEFKSSFISLLVFLVPLVVLVGLMVMGESAQKSLVYSILCMLVVGLVQQFIEKEENPIKSFIVKICNGLDNGARTCASIAMVMACMGIVVVMMTSTGLSSKISQFALSIAGDNLLLLAIVIAITCTLFGMGMPSGSAYVLAALLGAPALISFGVPVVVAHFFVFYFAEMSALTPPVAIGGLVASGLIGANFLKTCLTGMRLAIMGFVLPFLFLYRPELLLQGTAGQWAWAVLMLIAFLFCFISAIEGFLRTKFSIFERVIAVVGAVGLLIPVYVFDFVGLACFIVLLASQIIKSRKQGPAVKAA